MNHYEMMVILRPDLSEEQVQQQVAKYQDFLGQYNIQNLETKIWGKRRLAYQIARFNDGIYFLFNYQGDGKQIAPLERAMRLSDEVLRFMTIKLDNPKEAATPPAGETPALVEA